MKLLVSRCYRSLNCTAERTPSRINYPHLLTTEDRHSTTAVFTPVRRDEFTHDFIPVRRDVFTHDFIPLRRDEFSPVRTDEFTPVKKLRNEFDDDDELMLNVLRCQLTY